MDVVLNFKKKISVATHWNDLTRQQLLEIMSATFLQTKGKTGFEELTTKRLLVALALLNLPVYFLQKWRMDCENIQTFYEEVAAILLISDPFFKTIETQDFKKIYTLSTNLTDCKNLDGFRLGFYKYYGAGAILSDMTYDEFMLAEMKFISYSKESDDTTLDQFCAILFRPKYLFSNNIEAFDEKKIPSLSKRFHKAPKALKLAILHYYISCREYLTTFFNKIFDIKDDENRSKSSVWFEIKYHIAGTKFGTFQEVGKTKIFIILKHLQMLAVEREQQKIDRMLSLANQKK